MLLTAGCITSTIGDDDKEPAKDVTLIIDFEGFDPDSYQDQRVEWSPDGVGGWNDVVDGRPEGSVYVVNGLTATDALDVLVAASDATGIVIRHHVESQGGFVDSIDGVVNGRDGHYWSYYIDGEYGLEASDAAELEDGDEVRWVYMGNPFG